MLLLLPTAAILEVSVASQKRRGKLWGIELRRNLGNWVEKFSRVYAVLYRLIDSRKLQIILNSPTTQIRTIQTRSFQLVISGAIEHFTSPTLTWTVHFPNRISLHPNEFSINAIVFSCYWDLKRTIVRFNNTIHSDEHRLFFNEGQKVYILIMENFPFFKKTIVCS